MNEQLVKNITRARFVKATVEGKSEKRVASILHSKVNSTTVDVLRLL